MVTFLETSLYFGYNLFLFMLFFWIWVPGILLSALLTLRYRQTVAKHLLQGKDTLWTTLWAATVFGILSSPQRKSSLQTARILWEGGISPVGILVFLIASHSLVIYFLAVLNLLLGLEFALGQVLGGILMLLLVTAAVSALGLNHPEPTTSPETTLPLLLAPYPSVPSWTDLLFSRHGWWAVLTYIGQEFRRIGLNTLIGIFLGGFFLAGGLEPWWIDLALLGGGGVLTDLFNVLIAPLFSMILCVPPLGNLPLTASLFKAYVLNYPGMVSFVLASLVQPPMIRAYTEYFGRRAGYTVTLILWGAAMGSGLLVTGIFGLFGFRPGYVPLHPLYRLWDWLWQGE
ncbi:MAG: hypothetical protein D6736_07615 [Nitrospinota bacterium]|nr:MAG: hypothetical protein D6736_07615 [Nitrospinota bacterium]